MRKMLLSGVALVMLCTSSGLAQPAPGRGVQVNQSMGWIRDRMPNLYKLAAEGPRRQRWTQAVVNHAHLYQSANAAMKEKLNDTFKLEDEIYGMVIELDRAPDDQRQPIRDNIRIATRKLLQRNLNERDERIAKLKKDLAAQETQLKADRENIEAIVDRQVMNRFGIEPAGPTTGPSTRPDADAQPPAGEALTVPAP